MVIYVELGSAVESKLREKAMKRFGYAKGAIKDAMTEAVELWLSSTAHELEPLPVSAIRGILKGVRATSVELKHSARELFVK